MSETLIGKRYTNKDKSRVDRTILVTDQPNNRGGDLLVKVDTVSGPPRSRWMLVRTLLRKYEEVV